MGRARRSHAEARDHRPRRQGSGLGNVENAVNAPAYLTVDGSDDGKIKVEFGDDPARTGSYTFSFQVHNLTDAPLTYALDASVLAPYVIEKDGTKYIAPNDIQVGANVSFRTDAPGFDPNGDGRLDTQDVIAILDHAVGLEPLADAEGRLAVSQSIPFLAFWGNWTDSSMFDTSEYARDRYSTDAHKYLGISKENYYTVRVKGGNQYNLGVNPYAVDDAYIADRATTPPAA